MQTEIEIPEGRIFELEGNRIKVSGSKGTLERMYPLRNIKIQKKGNKIIISAFEKTSKNNAIVGSFISHISNMFKGVEEEFEYKLKICSSHFPMSVKIQGNEFTVSNFIGSKKIKKITIPEKVNVEVKGEIISVKSADIEKAGNFASKIELMTRLTKKDRRIFQDGIYMIEKNGVKIK